MKAAGRMKAWIGQDAKQVAKLGADHASWYVFFNDPGGKRRCKSCGAGTAGRQLARKTAQKIHAQLVTDTYEERQRETWERFRAEYDRVALAAKKPDTVVVERIALKHFERIAAPVRMVSITTKMIEEYAVKRSAERGKRKESTVSVATVNKELRVIKAVLSKARKWKFLKEMPDIAFLREPGRLPTFVTAEEFALIYDKCSIATMPAHANYEPAEWWRALIVMAYMTGWRIGELLAVRRADVDLAGGVAITRAEDNKGGRDERTPLHPLVVDHLKDIQAFDERLFPIDCHLRTLYSEFARIQEAAGIKLECRGKHEHTRSCHVYGFHDFRRGFATNNAIALSPVQLQTLMRHKSFATTKLYVNMAAQVHGVTDKLFVPTVGKVPSVAVASS